MREQEMKELESIKKLLVLQLLNQGIQAGAVAELLGMDPGDFSRMFPVKKLLRKRQED